MRGTYKNPTEDASPAPGGTGLPREGRKPVRDALGIGSDPSRQGRGPPPPLAGRVRRRPPPLAGRVRPNSERINCPPPYGGRDAIYATSVGFL